MTSSWFRSKYICDRLPPYSPWRRYLLGWFTGEPASTTQLEGAPPVGLGPKGSRLEGSPEAEMEEEHVGASAVELDSVPAAGWDPAHLPKTSMPRGAMHVSSDAATSREDSDACFVANRKLVALPGAQFPRKNPEALITDRELSKCHLDFCSWQAKNLDPTPLSGTYNNPHSNT